MLGVSYTPVWRRATRTDGNLRESVRKGADLACEDWENRRSDWFLPVKTYRGYHASVGQIYAAQLPAHVRGVALVAILLLSRVENRDPRVDAVISPGSR